MYRIGLILALVAPAVDAEDYFAVASDGAIEAWLSNAPCIDNSGEPPGEWKAAKVVYTYSGREDDACWYKSKTLTGIIDVCMKDSKGIVRISNCIFPDERRFIETASLPSSARF